MSSLTRAPLRVDTLSDNASAQQPLFRTIVDDDWRVSLRRSKSMPNVVSRDIRRHLVRAIGRGLVLIDHSKPKEAS